MALSLDFEKSGQMQRLGMETRMDKGWKPGSGLIYSITRRIQRFYCSVVNNTKKMQNGRQIILIYS